MNDHNCLFIRRSTINTTVLVASMSDFVAALVHSPVQQQQQQQQSREPVPPAGIGVEAEILNDSDSRSIVDVLEANNSGDEKRKKGRGNKKNSQATDTTSTSSGTNNSTGGYASPNKKKQFGVILYGLPRFAPGQGFRLAIASAIRALMPQYAAPNSHSHSHSHSHQVYSTDKGLLPAAVTGTAQSSDLLFDSSAKINSNSSGGGNSSSSSNSSSCSSSTSSSSNNENSQSRTQSISTQKHMQLPPTLRVSVGRDSDGRCTGYAHVFVVSSSLHM